MGVVYGLNPIRGIDQDLIRHMVVVIWGCRITPTGRLNVKGWLDVLIVQGQHEISILVWFLIFGELPQSFIS